MDRSTFKVKGSLLFCFFLVISIGNLINAQQEKDIPDIEKIYLHTYRGYYILGEALYHKAYYTIEK